MIMHKTTHLFLQRTYSAQATLPVPVIKVPKYVMKYVEKQKKKGLVPEFSNLNRKKISYRGDTRQTYYENYPLPIQSKYWFKPKSAGQKFTIHPIEPNPSLATDDPNEFKNEEHFPSEFTKFNLNQAIVDNLYKEFNFKKPTRIQTLAIPRILSGEHVLIATETGGGKTVSYLAPIIQNLIKIKKRVEPPFDTPLALVLVPGRELAEQVANVAYKLAQGANVDVRLLISPGTKLPHLRLYPKSNIDLLVASLGCFKKMFEKNVFQLSHLNHLVLDEADTLLDSSFVDDTGFILQRAMLKSRNSVPPIGAQLVLSSSIYPSNLSAILDESFEEEDIVKIVSPYLHRVPMHVQQKFIRVSQIGRAGETLQLVKKDFAKKKPVMVFCSQSPTCEWLHHFLKDNGVPNGLFHGGIGPNIRMTTYDQFREGILNVLVCTDLASRGLDTPWVKHVINFDFPNTVSDYLLRAGRVGRASTNQGHVTNIVVNKSTVYTVNEVETAVRLRRRIANVDSNIKQKLLRIHYRDNVDPKSIPGYF